MGGADVGGDGSVQWKVWGDNVKGPEKITNVGAHGRQHEHIDETDPGNFRISIQLPNDQNEANALVNTLKNLPPAVPGTRINFELPIVPNDTDQIQIRWDSRPAPAHHVHGAMAAIKTAVSKVTASIKTTGAKRKQAPKKASKKPSKKPSKKAKKKAGKKKR